jgi:hypothetical protein
MADDPDPGHMARFCREILPGILVEASGVAAPDAHLVADDVLLRAEAAARLDSASCEVLAAPFYEESFSHEPDEASAWMKAITTLVIRNSYLEEVHTNGPVTAGGITGITTYGLGPLSHLIAARRRGGPRTDAREDPFVGLAELYPRAWACLNAVRISLNCGGGMVGYRQPEAPIPGLPDISEVTEAPPADHLEMPSDAFKGAVFSGIDPRFDQYAFELLKAAEDGEMLLTLSSLSRISRNSCKLHRVLEFLLAHHARILTTNYLLTGKEAWVRRRELVKPQSKAPMDGLRNWSGLSGAHKKTVESYTKRIAQAKGQLVPDTPSRNVGAVPGPKIA